MNKSTIIIVYNNSVSPVFEVINIAIKIIPIRRMGIHIKNITRSLFFIYLLAPLESAPANNSKPKSYQPPKLF